MAHLSTPAIARQLGSLFDDGSLVGLSDRQLIERFNHRRDEAAFAALVARHGPMVLGVCRQLLADRHLAEDAFQATFLVLARKAHSLRDPDRLGTWLYGVALRTARKARTRLARQRIHEQGDVMDALIDSVRPTAPPADQALLDRDQAEILHGEIDRLPGIFRSPIVLCYFEGLTLDEAARQLRCPAGTLRSRLARAREKLRRALTRRGVVLAAALDNRLAPASVSPHLCDLTARAATPLRRPSGSLVHRGEPGPRGAPDHDDPHAEDRHRNARVPGRLCRRKRLSGIFAGHGRRAPPGTRSREAGRCRREACSRPDVRRRPCPRSRRPAGAERDGRHLPAAQAPVQQPRYRRELPDAGRPWGERRVGPVPARCGPRLVGPARAVRRHRAGTRLRRRLGRPRPRRGPAIGRDPAHAGTGHRGPALRPSGPARPGRSGLSFGDLAHPRADRVRPGSGNRGTHGRLLPMVGPRPRRAGLAEAGDDRRRRPLQPARHRPRRARQAERPRPKVRPADDRAGHRRPRGRQAPEGGAPAGPDPHRPRDLRRHRQAGRSCRGPRRRVHRAGRSPGGRFRLPHGRGRRRRPVPGQRHTG